MSKPRSIYVVSVWYIFSLLASLLAFIIMNHIISLKQAHVFLAHFLEYLLLFLDDNVDEESE